MGKHVIPTLEEFEIKGDNVTHKPTGATWTAYPGAQEPHICRLAMLGTVLPNGDDYRPHEVEGLAKQLLRERLANR